MKQAIPSSLVAQINQYPKKCLEEDIEKKDEWITTRICPKRTRFGDVFNQANGFNMTYKLMRETHKPAGLFISNNFIAFGELS
ncbi:MAG: hypothetical protein P4L50_08955 [Anaerolineaceae bacterium]|nr:hypothetical protein [Anaerolineaceae bacterium]